MLRGYSDVDDLWLVAQYVFVGDRIEILELFTHFCLQLPSPRSNIIHVTLNNCTISIFYCCEYLRWFSSQSLLGSHPYRVLCETCTEMVKDRSNVIVRVWRSVLKSATFDQPFLISNGLLLTSVNIANFYLEIKVTSISQVMS